MMQRDIVRECEFCTPAAARECRDPQCRAAGLGEPAEPQRDCPGCGMPLAAEWGSICCAVCQLEKEQNL